MKSDHGEIECRVVPGFTIDIRAIFNEEANLAALKKIME